MPWAMSWPRRERQIGGGKAEALAASGAALDCATHAPPIAELLCRLFQLAPAEMLAHLARGEHHAVIGHRLDDIDAEAELRAEGLELLWRAGAAFAVGEVVADHDMGRAEPLRDHVRGEGFGAQARQLGSEIDDEGLVEPEGGEKLKLHRQRRQAKEGLVRREELAGMRLEHHGARALAQFLGKVAGAAEHRLMSAMNAIEIADGEHCAFCLRRHIPPTGDDIHPCFLDERAIACAI